MNLKVCLLLFCLLQVAFFSDGHHRGNGRRDNDRRGPRRDNNFRGDNNRCRVYCDNDEPITLYRGSSRWERNDYNFNKWRFDGACDCEVNLWGNTNYGGPAWNSPYGRRNGDWNPNNFWNRKPRSWRVDCKF